jgi:hypothetical protein
MLMHYAPSASGILAIFGHHHKNNAMSENGELEDRKWINVIQI